MSYEMKIQSTDTEILADAPEGTFTAVHNTYSDEWLYTNQDNLSSLAAIKQLVEKDERIAELEEQIPKWVSVEDKLPEPETPVLAIVNGFDGYLTLERRWETCNPFLEPYFKDFLYWDWIDNDGQDFDELVTHWMLLPELPTKCGDL